MFSEKEYDVLHPHCPMDCAIEIVLGAKLPKPKLYSMTREMEELQVFIDKNLARDFIQLAKSCMAAPMLFREKKGLGCAWTTMD